LLSGKLAQANNRRTRVELSSKFGDLSGNFALCEPNLAGGEPEAVLAHFLPFSCTIKGRLVEVEISYEIGSKKGLGSHVWSLKSRES
jgi:hypothetical protein